MRRFKKLSIILCVLVGILLFPSNVSADSPVTSTGFSMAYDDISIVKKASESGEMDSTIANYLQDKSNPIDVKAAVINALSWSIDGKSNAETYTELIYNKSLKNVNIRTLSGDQQFCIGYLMAMDDYFNTETALEYLKLAEKNMPNSFTVSMIRALVNAMDFSGKEWNYVEKVLQNSKLKKDMREDAINIILDYMASYSNNKDIEVSSNNVLIENEESQIIYLYGTYVNFGEIPYQISQGSDIASAALCRDEYGVYYLKITGIQNGSSNIKIEYKDGKSKTINFDVVSSEVYKKLDGIISMYVGNINAYINKNRTTIDKKLVPYLKNEKQYIPLDFICKAVGGTIKYDSKKATSKFIYDGNTIIFKDGSNKIKLNGKTVTIESRIESKSKKQYITAKDFAELTDRNYIYSNGLIILSNNEVKLNAVTNDYLLEELSWMITKGKLTSFDPILFEQDNKYGYKDSKGNVIVKPIYEDVYDFCDGLASVQILDKQGNYKWGIIDRIGNYVVEPIYDMAGSYSNGLIPVKKDGKAGYLDKTGNIQIALQYCDEGYFNSGLAPVLNPEGTKWGYIDIEGNLVIPYSYEDATTFKEGLAAVQIDNKWGYIDRTGKLVMEPIYDEAYLFIDGIAEVLLDGNYTLINLSGQIVVYFDDGDTYVGEQKNGFLHGKGVYTYADGAQYTGDFLEGVSSGKGTLTMPDGSLYSGDFLNDDFSGQGVYYWPDGDQYAGEFKDGELNGRGKYTYQDGTVEAGYWKDGVFQG